MKPKIHTRMCYAEFGEILDAVVRMDADVISNGNRRLARPVLRPQAAPLPNRV
jgi:methionine synthase II (cobalamin-independent)